MNAPVTLLCSLTRSIESSLVVNSVLIQRARVEHYSLDCSSMGRKRSACTGSNQDLMDRAQLANRAAKCRGSRQTATHMAAHYNALHTEEHG